nr:MULTISPECIES: diguanylate cyclase [unclassified Bradyrhizobium]
MALADDRVYVGKPVLGRASNKWTIQLARKLFDLAGNPAGVVVGSISVDVVGRFYDTAKLGDGGTLVLRNANYVVLAARGVDQGAVLGQRTPNRVEGELWDGFYAQYWNENRPNRSDRLITARRSRAFPLIFTVGISEQEIYSRSDFRQKIYLGCALLLTFIILTATFFRWRRQQALDRAQRELRDFASKFEDALRNLPQGLSMFDGSDRLIAFNRQWLELYGLVPEEIRIGMNFREVFAKQTAVLDVEAYLVDLKNRLAQSEHTSNTVQFPDGRVAYISYGRREGGGWVATHEDISERKASEDRIERLAHYDSLTGLTNRNLFKERIDAALARPSPLEAPFAVLLLDLDKFKSVNDALGHQCGDALLKQVAGRITAQIRDVDIAARIGGDEFAVIVAPGRAAMQDGAASLAARLVQAIAEPYHIEGHPVVIGCSIGLALVPEHGTRVDEILRNADLALYKSKNAGRSCFHVYSAQLKAEADQRNVLEIELREAIWREEIEVFYQPVRDRARHRPCEIGRGSGALAPRHPRRHFSCRVHSCCGGRRTDRRARQSGADQGVPRCDDHAERCQGRGQPLGPAICRHEPCRHRDVCASAERTSGSPARARDHRERVSCRYPGKPQDPPAAQGARRLHCPRRLRRRLLVIVVSDGLPVQQSQDRQDLHRQDRSLRDSRSAEIDHAACEDTEALDRRRRRRDL